MEIGKKRRGSAKRPPNLVNEEREEGEEKKNRKKEEERERDMMNRHYKGIQDIIFTHNLSLSHSIIFSFSPIPSLSLSLPPPSLYLIPYLSLYLSLPLSHPSSFFSNPRTIFPILRFFTSQISLPRYFVVCNFHHFRAFSLYFLL